MRVDNDTVMRRVLRVGAVFNFGAALAFAFPSSWLGQIAGLPLPGPPFYATVVAFFVALFGGAYAWLAWQPSIDRPLITLAAIGKTGFVLIVFVFWLLGQASGRGLLVASGDLVFVALFVRWLLHSTMSSAAQGAPAARGFA